jgi:hypothetical protein
VGCGFLGERMTGVPAHCPHCGRIFISSLIGFGPGTTLTLNNVGVSCPFCGQIANAVDGTFDFVGNLVRVQNAPPRSIAILQVLQSALIAAQKGDPDAKVLEQIQEASPELAKEIQKATVTGGRPLLPVLLLLLAGSCSTTTNTSLNWNQLIDQARVYATGGDPYPGLVNSEEKPKMNRHQRRSQERQTKKQPQRPEPPSSKKPAR